MKNSNLHAFEIGDRIECCKYFGTIKYIGPVEGKSATWLGIDWDNPERGKHNGSVNGVQYFTARHPTSGSFVRPGKVDFGKSAVESIAFRYGQCEDEHTTKINQQQQLRLQQTMNAPFLEMVGFDKVFNKVSDLCSLKIVNLREQNISSAGPSKELATTCPSIKELDLSKNLFSSWIDIFEICEQLPSLNWLNVSENLLVIPDDLNHANYKFPLVKTLFCGHMELDWEDVLKIISCFPGIEELRVPYNKIHNLSDVGGTLPNLKLLDVEGNLIKQWSEVAKLGTSSSLEQLILEKIGLTSVEFEESTKKVAVFSSLKKMCIVDNLIRDWISVGELNRLQKFENLKFFRNPILETEDQATARQLIIAKIEDLKVLNGREIEPAERRGAEYDYIKKYGLEWLQVKGTPKEIEFLKLHNRYLELIQKYGEAEESELTVQSKIIKSSLIELEISYEGVRIKRKLPPSLTVQKLEMLVQKLFRLKERPDLIYVSEENTDIHITLDDKFKEIGIYSMQDGDRIVVA